MAASRSNRQLAGVLIMTASSAEASFAAPSKSLFANTRVGSAAFALVQNFASSFAKSCWLISHWNSICIANSRDFVRRDTLLAPRLSSVCQVRMRGAKLSRQLCHFDGGEARFESLVAAFEPRAVDGLLQRVARQHTETNRQATVHLRELQSARPLPTTLTVVRRFAPSLTSDSHDPTILPLPRHS